MKEDKRVCDLRKRVNKFFSQLTEDFPIMLDKLENLFPIQTILTDDDAAAAMIG